MRYVYLDEGIGEVLFDSEEEEISKFQAEADLAIDEYKSIADRIKLLKAEIKSLEDRQAYIREAFPHLTSLKAL